MSVLRLPTADETDARVAELIAGTARRNRTIRVDAFRFDRLLRLARAYCAYSALFDVEGEMTDEAYAKADGYLDECFGVCAELRAAGFES